MASSAVSTRSSMGKLATGTGSGLQGTENLWAAVEGLADMVRELKDNEKVENLEGAVKDLAVTISELDGNVRQLMEAVTGADATPVARAKTAGVKLEDGLSVEDDPPAQEKVVDLTGGGGKDKKRKHGVMKERKTVPGNSMAPRSAVEEAAKAFHAARMGKRRGRCAAAGK